MELSFLFDYRRVAINFNLKLCFRFRLKKYPMQPFFNL